MQLVINAIRTANVGLRAPRQTRWEGSAVQHETTLHQLSPYIGKIKSTIAGALVSEFTRHGEIVYDPFSGCGTVALEAWIGNRRVIANDLSPYAHLLTKAKLFPNRSHAKAIARLNTLAKQVKPQVDKVKISAAPASVREFFHPETLREVLAWVEALVDAKENFLLACLMGILHHQRPGFLSFPSSHAVPYLRESRFPRSKFPELYTYRPLLPRLIAKITRAYRRVPQLNFALERKCFRRDAAAFVPRREVDAIITSPPYMRQLDYGRDNRLRLWFLGIADADELDSCISPTEDQFISLMRTCLLGWKQILRANRHCILVLGDTISRTYGKPLPEVIKEIAVNEVGGFRFQGSHTDSIPTDRRVRRGCRGNLSETVLVLKKRK